MRLIDADALGNRMYHESFEKDSDLQRWDGGCWIRYKLFEQVLREMPTIDQQPTHETPSNTLDALESMQTTQLTDEDKETIRIHLNAFKESLCNQGRWYEATEYEELIHRLLSTPSAQPRKGLWIDIKHTFMTKCSVCDWINNDDSSYNFCPCCGTDMRPQFEEPEINPCRGCEDYDWKGGCKSKGGCADRRGEQE